MHSSVLGPQNALQNIISQLFRRSATVGGWGWDSCKNDVIWGVFAMLGSFYAILGCFASYHFETIFYILTIFLTFCLEWHFFFAKVGGTLIFQVRWWTAYFSETTRRDLSKNDKISHFWVTLGKSPRGWKVTIFDYLVPGGVHEKNFEKFFRPRIRVELGELCRKTCLFASRGGI